MSEGSNSQGMVRSYVERATRLEEEKRERSEDLKELWAEAKSNGFDADDLAGMKTLVKEALEDGAKRKKRVSRQEALERMRAALGPLDGTPLGNAAMAGV